jgi:hypothetical protein
MENENESIYLASITKDADAISFVDFHQRDKARYGLVFVYWLQPYFDDISRGNFNSSIKTVFSNADSEKKIFTYYPDDGTDIPTNGYLNKGYAEIDIESDHSGSELHIFVSKRCIDCLYFTMETKDSRFFFSGTGRSSQNRNAKSGGKYVGDIRIDPMSLYYGKRTRDLIYRYPTPINERDFALASGLSNEDILEAINTSKGIASKEEFDSALLNIRL